MTDKARQIVEDLRWFISYYPKWSPVDPCKTLSYAAELIERLSAELEAAKSNAQNTHVSQSAQQEWISVADRMPAERDSLLARWYGTERRDNTMWRKQSEAVIVCRRYPDGSQIVMTDRTHDGRWFESKLNICSGQVTHWMPMPEPPKADGGESEWLKQQ